MAVTFTSNIGLAKPDETELALNWARGTKLAEDNNLIIADKADINIVAYTPTVTATTTAPNFGAGSARAEYTDFQGLIMGTFSLKFDDPGISAGVGDYAVSLPFVADSTFHIVGTAFNATPGPFSVIGEGYGYDDSNVNGSGALAIDIVTVAGVSYARMLTEVYTVPTKTTRFAGGDRVFVPVNLDRYLGNFCYKKA